MAWTDRNQPSRSRDELLAQVIGRGKTLRRRRQAATAAVAGALLVVISFVAVSLVHPGGGPSRVATTNGAATTTSTTSEGPVTAASAVPPTTVVAPVTAPLVRPAGTTTSTTGPKTTTTVSRPRTSVTVEATTTTTLPTQVCDGAELDITVSFDRSPPVYQPGQPVSGILTVRYVGQSPCLAEAGYSFGFEVFNAGGQQLTVTAPGLADASGPFAVSPGYTLTVAITLGWNQQGSNCPGAASCQEPPGTYTYVGTFAYDGGTAGKGSAPFRLAAAAS